MSANTVKQVNIDSVVNSLSELSIKEPRKRSWVLENVLREVNLVVHDAEWITDVHPVFQPAKTFRVKWNIGLEQWNNFVRLLRGCRHFPIIILQNPSRQHSESFEEMRKGSTISWLEEKLGTVGLPLDSVPILDICSFFSDEELSKMDPHTRWKAVEEAYGVVEEMLNILRPKVVLCCQCATRGRWVNGVEVWRKAENSLARQLGSSMANAKEGLAIPISMNTYTMWAVQGFHPQCARRDHHLEVVLVQILEDVFTPCFERAHMALFEEVVGGIDDLTPLILAAARMACELGLYDDGLKTATHKWVSSLASWYGAICNLIGDVEAVDERQRSTMRTLSRTLSRLEGLKNAESSPVL